MKPKCFTIGHSNHHISRFIELLEMHHVTLVIDVRSSPFSRYMTNYNKDILPGILSVTEIQYAHLGTELGGRTSDRRLMTDDGQTDYRKVMETASFKAGIRKVLQAMGEGENVVLMCAEKDPLDCHRFVLVSRALSLEGTNVLHILDNGELRSNAELEKALLERYKLDNGQTTLFGERKSEFDLIDEAYLLRGREIAYHPDGGKA
jgi:uncharacterized protein (DUF488 family)